MKPENPENSEALPTLLAKLLGKTPGKLGIRALPGDASSRRFFRILDGKNQPLGMLAMVYPPGSRDDIARFLSLARLFRRARIPCPAPIAADPGAGTIIVEDLGDRLLQDVGPRECEQYYRRALQLLRRLQKNIPPDSSSPNPPFDRGLFRRELHLFTETAELAGAGAAWEELFELVLDAVSSQPEVFCHRDYHCRNILLARGQLFAIDFQDARRGPYTYDLVSLVHDPYAGLEHSCILRLRGYYLQLLGGISPHAFARDCDMMLIQRVLKAAGTYGSVFRRLGDDSYLKYLAPCREAIRGAMERQEDLVRFLHLLDDWTPGPASGT